MEAVQKVLIWVVATVIATAVLAVVDHYRPASPSAAAAPTINIALTGSAAAPSTRATIYSAPWCIPCRAYLSAVKAEMPPVGWLLRESTDAAAATAHIVVDKEEKAERLKRHKIAKYPTTIIERDGVEVDRIEGRVTPEELANRINAAARK